mmetsp:Transcript_13476/g.32170  ORF Transcript_13476/g.32170 Transcript_13476/m.32170 type:complete len:598 (-) Transcript_13476:114-1907(-)
MHAWAVNDGLCGHASASRPWNEGERPATEPITGREPQGVHPSAPASPIRITMPAMITHSSKVVLHEDPLPQRLLMLEQKCRAQEAMLLEKDAHLQKLKESADGEQLRLRVLMLEGRCRSHEAILSEKEAQLQKLKAYQPRVPLLEQKVQLQEAELHDRDKQIHKLTEIVDQAKSSLQQLAIEADSENNELQAELIAMKEKLECVADETRSRQEVDQLDKKLAESEAMCQALRWELDAISVKNGQETATSADPGNDLTDREVTALRAEAVRLRELQQLQWQQHAANAQRFRAELTALRAALRREGLAVDSGMELAADVSSEALEEAKMETALAQKELEEFRGLAVQATSEVVKLREGLSEAEAALETERRTRRQAVESLHQCEEVAAKLMAERNAAREELEEHTMGAEAFRKQAASDMRESRWARFTLRLLHLIDGSTFDELKESWSYGLQRWQAFATTLTEKINSRAQEIAGNCAKGDKALQALNEKITSQELQMAAFADKAVQEFSEAQKSWEECLKRERTLRLSAEEDLRKQCGEQAVDSEKDRSEVERLQKQLAEAQHTIGQLVVQSLEPAPKKAAASKTASASLRSRTRSSLT